MAHTSEERGRSGPAQYRAPAVDGSLPLASRRLRALAELSGSLTDALNPEEAAQLVEQRALRALDATSAVVVTLGPFPPVTAPDGDKSASADTDASTLFIVHAIGVSDEIAAGIDRTPLDAPIPYAQVARDGVPLFMGDGEALMVFPAWGAAVRDAGVHAAAIVPVWANGELRGVLGLTWSTACSFDEDERAFVSTLGVMCAQAIMRAHLRAAERAAREEAERANRSKANFLATISHELRTPVNAVLGYSQLLSDGILGPVSDRQQDHLERMSTSGRHLLGLIDDLLGYARIDAGREVVRPTSVMLLDVVSESIALVGPIAMRKGITVRVQQPPAPVELFTDARKLCQILVNVIANAIKYSGNGEVSLVVRVEGVSVDLRMQFEITDTGQGIAEDDQEHIFDAFWQKDPVKPNSEGSTGLGLPVARQLARLLGGDLTLLRSAVDKGSTFLVSLPLRYDATKGAAAS